MRQANGTSPVFVKHQVRLPLDLLVTLMNWVCVLHVGHRSHPVCVIRHFPPPGPEEEFMTKFSVVLQNEPDLPFLLRYDQCRRQVHRTFA